MKEIDTSVQSPEALAVQQLDALAEKLFQNRPVSYQSGEMETDGAAAGAVVQIDSPRHGGTFLERRTNSDGTVAYDYSVKMVAGNKSGVMYASWRAGGDSVKSGIYTELNGTTAQTTLSASRINNLRKNVKEAFKPTRATRAGFIGRLITREHRASLIN